MNDVASGPRRPLPTFVLIGLVAVLLGGFVALGGAGRGLAAAVPANMTPRPTSTSTTVPRSTSTATATATGTSDVMPAITVIFVSHCDGDVVSVTFDTGACGTTAPSGASQTFSVMFTPVGETQPAASVTIQPGLLAYAVLVPSGVYTVTNTISPENTTQVDLTDPGVQASIWAFETSPDGVAGSYGKPVTIYTAHCDVDGESSIIITNSQPCDPSVPEPARVSYTLTVMPVGETTPMITEDVQPGLFATLTGLPPGEYVVATSTGASANITIPADGSNSEIYVVDTAPLVATPTMTPAAATTPTTAPTLAPTPPAGTATPLPARATSTPAAPRPTEPATFTPAPAVPPATSTPRPARATSTALPVRATSTPTPQQ